MYQQARRGRENIRTMTKDAFKIATDDVDGRQFIYQHTDKGDKNHGIEDVKIANEGRIYENKGTLNLTPPLVTQIDNFQTNDFIPFSQRAFCAL